MLRIEKVQLQGFKSFCDPTEVVFDQDAITAVVGPNGCGKSNVADALNWVIGEQRAKNLRGGKMEDVIFQGSRNRQPAGMAEVILTLRVCDSFEIRTQENVKSDYKAAKKAAKQAEKEAKAEAEAELAQAAEVNAEPSIENLETPSNVDSEVSLEAAPAPDSSAVVEAIPEAIDEAAEKASRSFGEATARIYQPGEKISIARRLYRTGDSEYEMNGKICRLRDIQDLFAGTGLGASHYAIIEQGRIGQVLSAKPMDRRSLIEEAAGISKFKARQHSAELKLEAARANLSRLNDIIVEVDRQQNSLKRQAAKARRFEKLRQRIRILSSRVFVADHQLMNHQIEELETARRENLTREEELGSRLAEAEEERGRNSASIQEIEQRLFEAREALNASNLEMERARQQQKYLTEQIENLGRRIAVSERDRDAITERGEFTTLEAERLQGDLRTLEEEINVDAASLSKSEEEHQLNTRGEREVEQVLEQTQAAVREAATLRERWRQLLRQFGDSVERAERQVEGLGAEHERALSQEMSLAGELENTNLELESLETSLNETTAALVAAETTVAARQEERRELEINIASVKSDLTAVEQRLRSLTELDEQKSHYSEAIQAIMKRLREPAPFKVLGTLADFVEVGSAQEKMVEIGLREEMQYLVVPTFDDAVGAITFLKEGNHGRATFLVVENGHSGAETASVAANGDVRRLMDVLGLRPDIRQALRQALPRLADAVVADEIGAAIEASIRSNGSGHSYLTTAGEFVSAGHLISGGSFAEHGIGVLALKREISELRDQAVELDLQLRHAGSSLEAVVSALESETLVRKSLAEKTHKLEKDLVGIRSRRQQVERDLERARTHLRVVEKERGQITTELDEFRSKLTHAEVELSNAEEALVLAEEESQRCQAKVSELRLQAQERAQELSRRRADFAAKSERRKALQNDIRRLQAEAQDISRQLSRSQMEAVESAGKLEADRQTLAELVESLAERELVVEAQRASVRETEELVAMEKARAASIEALLAELRSTSTATRETRSEIDISRTRLLSSLEHLSAQCYAELGESLEELVGRYSMGEGEAAMAVGATIGAAADLPLLEDGDEGDDISFERVGSERVPDSLPADFDLEAARKELNELKAKVENLGPVNLLALQELGELEERLVFLLEQKADIDTAVRDTHAAIQEIKKRSRDRFMDAFTQINRNFSEMFLELFGGGHGEMRLIDETDVLESGIDIIAQPPGKRLQNVLLLSGGEKAMAALALVMGIFKYRPSPFCLLDEVDAPLDEANIARFADKILEMSANTQFMVITHSKRTMEAAKTLYGVTMEDPGVSKLISVRLT